MPVSLEKVVNPSAQDLIDLEKIYHDYPGDTDFSALQQQLQQSQGQMELYAARFNARLIGALSVDKSTATLVLDHLCVRSVTRQRHVGRDILRLLKADSPATPMQLSPCHNSLALEKLMATAGFKRQGTLFSYAV